MVCHCGRTWLMMVGKEKAKSRRTRSTQHSARRKRERGRAERESERAQSICIHVVVFHFTSTQSQGTWGYQQQKNCVVFGTHANDIFVNNKSFWVHSRSHDRFERVLGAVTWLFVVCLIARMLLFFAPSCAKACAYFRQTKHHTQQQRLLYIRCSVWTVRT